VRNLIDIDDLDKADIYQIWRNVDDTSGRQLATQVIANIAWSFEGNGIRTRTTFIQSFQKIAANYVELPNLLKTNESVTDLAGYLDSYYSIYVIRDNNHQRLKQFAQTSSRPVINAMSCDAHPCEVLTDAYSLYAKYGDLENVRILLWGPTTNVFKSWHSLAKVLGLKITHYCPAKYHTNQPDITYIDSLQGEFDVVITDAWPAGFSDSDFTLNDQYLANMGEPILLPTPPVTPGNEVAKKLSDTVQFIGYQQKSLLLPVQIQIVKYLLSAAHKAAS